MSCPTQDDLRGVYLICLVQNANIMRSNNWYREEVLRAHVFDLFDDTRRVTAHCVENYKTNQPDHVLWTLFPSQ